MTFITRVQWLSLRGLNNQYVKLSGYVLTPTTHLQTPGCFFIKGGKKMLSGSRECQEPRQGALDFRNMLYFPLTSPDTHIYCTILYFLENVTISGSITLEEQYRKEGKLHLSTLISSSFLLNIGAKPL